MSSLASKYNSFATSIGRTILSISVPNSEPATSSQPKRHVPAFEDGASKGHASNLLACVGKQVIHSGNGLLNAASGLSNAGTKIGSQVMGAASQTVNSDSIGSKANLHTQADDDEANKGHAASPSNLLSCVGKQVIRSASGLSNAASGAASGLSSAGSMIGSQVKGAAAQIGQDIENSGEGGRQLMEGLSAAKWVTGMVTGVAANTAVGSLKSAANVATSTVTSAKSVGAGTISISRTTWYYFFLLFASGAAILMLSTMFLPMVVLAPQQFSLLFTLGSLCILLSFSVLRGHVEFLKYLLDWSRIGLSGTYVISLLGTLWSSLYVRSYTLTVIFSGVQVYALGWFLVSYIPGGTRVLKTITGCFWMAFKGCLRCTRNGGPSLPF